MSEQLHDDVDRSVFASIAEALEDVRNGKIVLVVDDADRENEGDFIIAAEKATPEAINFMVTHGRGIVCLPAAAWRLDELGIPLMVTETTDGHETAFTVSIDYRHGTTTGTSAQDRSVTVRAVDRPRREGARLPEARPRLPAEGPRGRRAGARRPHGGRRRSRAPGGTLPGGRDLRGDEPRRLDGPAARARPRRARARPEADLDRRPDRVPTPSRDAGRAGGRGDDPDRVRRVPVDTPTRASSTAARTSPWCWARSATATGSSCGCTPSA